MKSDQIFEVGRDWQHIEWRGDILIYEYFYAVMKRVNDLIQQESCMQDHNPFSCTDRSPTGGATLM